MTDNNTATTARAVNLGNSCRACSQYHDGDGLLCNKCPAQEDKQQSSMPALRATPQGLSGTLTIDNAASMPVATGSTKNLEDWTTTAETIQHSTSGIGARRQPRDEINREKYGWAIHE